MKIVIGADIVPTKTNFDYFSENKLNKIVEKELMEKINKADFRIFDLECVLTDEPIPIKKSGHSLFAPTSCVKGLKQLNIDLIAYANNHTLDGGCHGFAQTTEVLKNMDISYFGAGENLQEAEKPYIIKTEEYSVGIFTCTEHEFSLATDSSPGANPFDLVRSYEIINELKQKVDYIIVLYHGGIERYRYPSPNLQMYCRKFVDCGADLVVAQHSQCVGSMEEYENGTIIYGQGNFLFDRHNNDYYNSGLLVCIDIEKDKKPYVSYIPFEKNKNGVKSASDNSIMNNFIIRSERIKEKGFIEKKFAEYSKDMLHSYLFYFNGKKLSLFSRVMAKIFGKEFYRKKARRMYNDTKLLRILNIISCEAHREMVETAIKDIVSDDI